MVQIVSLDLLKNILNVCKQHLTDEGYFKKTVVTIYTVVFIQRQKLQIYT